MAPIARHPADWLVAAYLVATLVLILVRPPSVDPTPVVVLRGVVLVAILAAWRFGTPRVPWMRFIRVAYPALLYGAFYAELDILNTTITQARFDEAIVAAERAVFRSMPSVELREWIPWWPFAELVHVGYVAYYVMVPALLLTLLLKRNLAAVSESVFAVTATFMACYFFFISLPVVGPYHFLDRPVAHDVGPFLPVLTQRILDAGSSIGTAFPSSHVAVGVAVSLAALRYSRTMGTVLSVLTVLMAIGAVYGGYHYAIDATVGAILAIAIAPAARAVWRALGGYPAEGVAG